MGPQARRRKTALTRAPAHGSTAAAQQQQQLQQQKATGDAMPGVAARTRGRVGLRRRELNVPARSAGGGIRTEQSELVSVHPVAATTGADEATATSSAAGQRTAPRNAGAARVQPKAGTRYAAAAASSAATAANAAKADLRTRARLDEKPPNSAADIHPGKRRVEGGTGGPETNKIQRRRVQ